MTGSTCFVVVRSMLLHVNGHINCLFRDFTNHREKEIRENQEEQETHENTCIVCLHACSSTMLTHTHGQCTCSVGKQYMMFSCVSCSSWYSLISFSCYRFVKSLKKQLMCLLTNIFAATLIWLPRNRWSQHTCLCDVLFNSSVHLMVCV